MQVANAVVKNTPPLISSPPQMLFFSFFSVYGIWDFPACCERVPGVCYGSLRTSILTTCTPPGYGELIFSFRALVGLF